MTSSGGLRCAPTPGYSPATLRVANADDESSTVIAVSTAKTVSGSGDGFGITGLMPRALCYRALRAL